MTSMNQPKNRLINERKETLTKIMKGIEVCRGECSKECPYYNHTNVVDCQQHIKDDMYDFIKTFPSVLKMLSESESKLIFNGNSMNFQYSDYVAISDISSIFDV